MKTLLLLRHGKSRWKDASLPDFERPLSGRGRKASTRMGRLLRSEGLLPERIVSSPAVRSRKTALRVARRCGYTRGIELQPELYHATAATICEVLGSLWKDPGTVLLVGHNPGLEELLSTLTGCDEPLPTAALAQLAVPVDSWQDLRLDTVVPLVNLWRPRELEQAE